MVKRTGSGPFGTEGVRFIPKEYWEFVTKKGTTMYFVKDPEENVYSTFNAEQGKMLKAHEGFGEELTVVYQQKGEYKNIWSVQSAGGEVV